MGTAVELLRRGKTKDIWRQYCGFIDLSIEEFMETQRHLLLEQLRLLENCELGRKMLWGTKPSSVEEFRQRVPLTTYKDYVPYLLRKRDDVLPEKPLFWQRTSGGSAKYRFKWVPITERLYRELGVYLIAWVIFSSCKERGDITLREHDKFFWGMAPPPYPTGSLARVLDEEFVFDVLPPRDEAEKMAYQDRMQRGISLAVPQGLDFAFALSSVLTAVGEQVSQAAGELSIRTSLSHPKALSRLVKGRLMSRLAKRPMLPKDLWRLKGLTSTGTDSAVFREKIAHYWGRYPLEAYGCAELGIFALQAWDYKDMTFVPTIAFFEFIPEEERQKSEADQSYRPRTMLLDEVKPGQRYEIVFTSLQGGPFVRYRIGDMIRITALRNEELNIDLPQMLVDTRADALIDIGGFARLSESTISEAMRNSRVACEVWTARKEAIDGQPVLHIYMELKGRDRPAEEVRLALHQNLKKLDHDYFALEDMLGLRPLKVTLLPRGTFRQYLWNQQSDDADLDQLRPPSLNASDEVIDKLLSATAEAKLRGWFR